MRRVLILMVASLAVSALAQGPGVSGNAKVRRATASAAGVYWTDPNASRLMARYDFETASWKLDTSGNGWTLADTGGTAQGIVGTNSQGRVEDGTSHASTFLQSSTSFGTTFNTPYSYSFWVNPTAGTWNEGVIGIDPLTGGAYVHTVILVSGGVNFQVNGLEGTSFRASVPAGIWTHVVCTYDGTTKNVYTNGAFAISEAKSFSGTKTGKPLSIGVYYSDAYRYTGLLDAMKVYTNCDLSTNTVAITNLFLKTCPTNNLENR